MGAVKRYVKKQARRAKGWAKKRYMPGGRVDYGRIVKDVSLLKNAINVEHKVKDETHNPNVFTGSSYVKNLTDIAQGTGQDQRIGNSLKLNYIQVRGKIERSQMSLASGGPNAVRVMLVLDKEPLAGALTNGNFDSTGGGLLNANSTIALRQYNIAVAGRYKVLIDKIYNLDGVKTNTLNINWFRKMETRCKYSGTLGSTQTDNTLYLIVIADGATADLSTTMYSRLKYVDN